MAVEPWILLGNEGGEDGKDKKCHLRDYERREGGMRFVLSCAEKDLLDQE